MADANIVQILIAASLIAGAGGLLGSFALLRRMALVGDALSHIALPGVALGILFNFNIFIGSLAFLLLGTLGIWAVEHKTKLPVDTLVGIFFTLALALGALLTPKENILEALFGSISEIKIIDFWLASILSVITIVLLLILSKKIILTIISPDLSLSVGFNPHKLEFVFLLIFALTAAVGIKFAGALLMGSLIIIPAATARNFSQNMKSYMALCAVFGAFGALSGVLASYFYGFPPGPTFVIIAGLLFFISVFFKK